MNLLGPIVLPEQAAPATPASGSAAIYAKTDGKVYLKNDAGTEYDLTATAGGTDPVVRTYSASDTWSKPEGLAYVLVSCWSGGGGGGSGRRGAASTHRCGGVGGSGGRLVWRMIPASELDATMTITVGAGGDGGAAVTADNTNGNTGGDGGNTEFTGSIVGTLVRARSGRGGTAGGQSSTANPGNSYTDNIPSVAPFSTFPSSGGIGRTNTGGSSVAHSDSNNPVPCVGGGGAGGVSTANTVGNGGAGANVAHDSGAGLGTNTAGVAGTTTGSRNGGDGTSSSTRGGNALILGDVGGLYVGSSGGGGAGGDSAGTIAGGNGGNGGITAGGGGGGGSTNGANSGRGGNGGNGFCVIVEFYGA